MILSILLTVATPHIHHRDDHFAKSLHQITPLIYLIKSHHQNTSTTLCTKSLHQLTPPLYFTSMPSWACDSIYTYQSCMHIYTIHIYMYIYMCIHIGREREREGGRAGHPTLYIRIKNVGNIYMCIYICVYT